MGPRYSQAGVPSIRLEADKSNVRYWSCRNKSDLHYTVAVFPSFIILFLFHRCNLFSYFFEVIDNIYFMKAFFFLQRFCS